MSISYPGESEGYRTARNALLAEEIALREKIENVARMRRDLPAGGVVEQDYEFVGADKKPVRLSKLFSKKSNTLALYSLMYKPDSAAPCPMCVSMLDGLAAQAPHINQLIDFAVVSSATTQQLAILSNERDWSDLTLLSAQGTDYQMDYHGETKDGSQVPMMNVFRKTPSGVFHFWGSEMFFADIDGQPRHVDQLWPLWNMLDLTPDGRGADWYPGLTYK